MRETPGPTEHERESLEATRELLSDPAAIERIRVAEAAVAAGDFVTLEEMAALMDERRSRESGVG